MRAKKYYGQNFLVDDYVVTKIIESIPKNDNIIVEIGAGLGDFTKGLIPLKNVVSFEIDNSLIKHLHSRFSKEIAENRLKLNNCDVLDAWQSNLVDVSYDLVANLPYYIGTTIVLKALKDVNCKNILVMLQKEVVDKFCAECKDSSYSALSILVQSVAKVTKIMDVDRKSFNPQPKVMSSVVLLEKFKDRDKDLEELLKVAFANPRKLLIKNLSLKYDKTFLQKIFVSNNFDLNKRAGETTLKEFIQILNNIK